jgi:hypothetical protein
MTRFVRIKKFADLTGYTKEAVEAKIKKGVWLSGREYRKAPDGNILVDMEGYESWVEHAHPPGSNLGKGPSGSSTRGSESGAARRSTGRRPPPTSAAPNG